MVSAMQRLGFTPSVTIEQRRLAVDLSEVVIKWELQRIKDQQVGRQPLESSLTVLYASPWRTVRKVKCVCVSLSRMQTWTQIQVEKESTLSHLPLKEACRWTLHRK